MKNKKVLFIIGAIIGLAVLALILEKTHVINLYHKNMPVASQGPTAEQKQQESQVNSDTKKQFIDAQSDDTNSTPAPNKSIELTAQQETNNTVTVFTKLPGYSSGTCALTVANGTKTTTQSANVVFQPEYSSCAGFSVPIDSVGKGVWTIKLAVTSNGAIESKAISYEVK